MSALAHGDDRCYTIFCCFEIDGKVSAIVRLTAWARESGWKAWPTSIYTTTSLQAGVGKGCSFWY